MFKNYLISMVSKEFMVLVLLAGVIALPAAWYLMKNWLQDFVYRVDMRIEMFIHAGFITLLIAFATISIRAFKAAVANPVDSLKND